MADAESIDRRFRSDVEAAEAWKEANPERYAEEITKAHERRGEAYREMATERDTELRKSNLSSAREKAITEFPLADPDSIAGETPEAVRASAERSHKFTATKQEEAQKAALEARRPATRQAWTGSQNGTRVGVPGGELRQPESETKALVERTYDRTAQIINESRKPGTMRRYSDDTLEVLRSPDTEAQAIADYRVLHPNTHLSDVAMRARAEGGANLVAAPSGVPADEDAKG